MVHRRSVLKLGAASVAGALLRMPAPAWGDARAPFDRAVFDERFDESVAFAAEFRRRGVVTASVGSDIARLWYDELWVPGRDVEAGFRRPVRALHVPTGHAPRAIAGLTDRATVFCLEELARSAGMRVMYRVDHLIDPRGHVDHDPAGPAAVEAAARTLAPGPGFGRRMAVLAGRFDPVARHEPAAMKRTGPFAPEGKVALVSWVIA